MDLVTHHYMFCSLATVEYWIQQKQLVEFDGLGYTSLHVLFTGLYTVEYWIQQKQLVEFDGFGTHGYMLCSLGYILWSTESMDFDG